MKILNNQRISNNLRNLRCNKSWKFCYLSKLSNIEENRLRRFESCKSTPNHFELYALSRIFDVTIDELVCKEIERKVKGKEKCEDGIFSKF